MSFTGTERFEILDHLGQGGMGAVYRARDRQRGGEVALKTLTEVDAERIAMLKAEFRSLADLTHTNLVGLYELFNEAEQWFFTMELIEGVDFVEHVRGKAVAAAETYVENDEFSGFASFDSIGDVTLAPEAAQRLWLTLPQLVEGVVAIHRAGKLHRDLKPGNVLVDHRGRVVILDFGLVTSRQRVGPDTALSAGTPAYIPPEVYQDQQDGPARDFFAIGVMLYQALTGRLPYYNASVFQSPTEQLPDPPSQLVDGVPPELEALAFRLLRWHPDARATGEQALELLGLSRSQWTPAIEEVFIGRAQELGVLQRAFGQQVAGDPAKVWVSGLSGLGKSTLVQRFLEGLANRDDGTLILAGRCHERESVTYKAFDGVIDGLVGFLKTLPEASLEALIPHEAGLLAKVFTAFQRLSVVKKRPMGTEVPEPAILAQRAAVALRQLLVALSRTRPVVVFIDDLQWGDLDSARLFSELFRTPLPVLFIATYRTENRHKGEVLDTLLKAAHCGPGDVHLSVEPLPQTDAEALARALLRGGRSDRLRQIVDEAAGSPFFVEELARYSLIDDTSEEVLLEDAVRMRIHQLTERAREVLEAICVIGRPAAIVLVLEVAGIQHRDPSLLLTLRNAHMIRSEGIGLDDRVQAYHDRIREAVVADIDGPRQQSLHRRVAEALETLSPDEVEALADHWSRAGELKQSVGYLLKAARAAAMVFAFDRAAEHYRRVLESGVDLDRVHVAEALADALRDAGRGPDAAARYLETASYAQGYAALDLRRRAFEQLLISGHVDEGTEVARSVLRDVGASLPTQPQTIVAGLLSERAKLWLRGTGFTPRTQPMTETQQAWVDTCWAMATGLSIVDSKLGAMFTTRFLRAALDSGDEARIARGLGMEAAHQSTTGAWGKAEDLLTEAFALVERVDDPHTLGHHLVMRGFVRYFAGEWREALEAFDRAATVLSDRCSDVNWELATALVFANWSLVYLGDWQELCARGPRLIASAEDRGNRYLAHGGRVSSSIIGHLVRDDVAAARGELEHATASWSTRGFQIQHFLYMYMGGWVDLYGGTAKAGHRRTLRDWPGLKRSLLLQVGDVRLRTAHVRGYLACASGALGDARKMAKLVAGMQSKGAAGLAEVIEGSVCWQQGNKKAGVKHLNEAIDGFYAVETGMYATGCRLVLGELTQDSALVAQAIDVMRGQGIADPYKMARVFAPGFLR